MRRGDVLWVDLDPVRGNEAAKRRPAVVVSNDGANRVTTTLARGVVTIVPVTSQTNRVYPFQVLLPAGSCGLPKDSKAQPEQVRSVSIERVVGSAGRLPPNLLDAIDRALRLHLDL